MSDDHDTDKPTAGDVGDNSSQTDDDSSHTKVPEEPDQAAPAPRHAAAAGAASDGQLVNIDKPDTLAETDTGELAVVPAESRRRRRKRIKAATPRRKAPWWELPALVILAVGIAIVVKSFIVQPFYIPSESMEHTLHGCTGCSGDRILVNKPIYSVLRDPEAGDIVVFHAPDGWDSPSTQPPSNPVLRTIRGFGQLIGFVPPDGEVLVKRVIATGGQTVKGDARGHVMISTHGPSGPYRTLHEPYVFVDAGDNSQPAFGPVTVPKGRLWVMGDHRNRSADSRYHCTPGGAEDTSNDLDCDPTSSTVPDGDVIGKAFVIAWPPSRWDILGTPNTFQSAAAAAGPTLPVVAGAAVMLPVVSRRRRRRRG
ncbi:MAG: signal peptidase I [Jatrophihabitans sp.]